MKTELEINELILSITTRIREEHPELLKYLNEMPITVPYEENPKITVETLTTYYDSLIVLVEDYENVETKKVLPKAFEKLPIIEISTMEQDTSYQNLLTEANNVTLSYNDVGEGNIPIIFLHGYPFDKSTWKIQMDSLKSTYRVIAFDIRGFGKSTDEMTELSIDLFAEDLVSFMDKLNIKKSIVCGLSMGGYIALNAIIRFPERFKALILCDTQCISDTAEVKENRYTTIEQINNEGLELFIEKFVKSVFHPETIVNKTELVENLRKVVIANSKDIITSGLIALAERTGTCSSLETIQIPTLIICGENDKLTPVTQSQFMHELIKYSTLKIITGAGHVSNLEQPDEFNKHLLEFLNTLNITSNSEAH